MAHPLSIATLMLALAMPIPVTAAAGDCVILLHGLTRTPRSMKRLESAFRSRGYQVANVGYPSRRHSIDVLADLAVSRGLAACPAPAAGRVHFVTHSLGGILVRHYLSRHALPNLGRVVMLAPPNQGSEVVDRFGRVPGFGWLNGPAGFQLGTGPNSVPLQLGPVDYPVGVIAGTRSINPLLSSAFSGANDGKVSVERSRIDGMVDFITVPVSHPFIMKDPRVIEQALAFIENETFMHSDA